MKDIDFLPSRFRECGRQRRAFVGRVAAFCAVAALIVAFHISQLAVRRSVLNDLQPVRERYPLAVADAARLQRLQSDLAVAQQFAELYTYLEYPWPRTQLLAGITQTLPDAITLNEIRLAPVLPSGVIVAPQNPAPDAANEIPAALRDLKILREEHDRTVTVVTLVGTASDVAELHTFVASFLKSPLFATANLESLESTNQQDKRESKFEIRLTVRPGYGQPGGPTGAPPAVANSRDEQKTSASAETR